MEKIKNATWKKKEREQEQQLQKENLSLQLSKCVRLWACEEDVVKDLQLLKAEGENRLALKVQLNFKGKVLLTKCEKSLFHLSSGEEMKPINEVRDNLFKIIKWNIKEETNEVDNFSMVIAEDVLENQKLKSAELAKKERQKESQPPPAKRRCIEITSNKKVD